MAPAFREVYLHFIKKAVCLLFLPIAISCSYGQTEAGASRSEMIQTEYSIKELNPFILKELNRRKIVMLSDSYHGHGFFLTKVTRFLNYWLDQTAEQKQTEIPQKLVLFLEGTDENIGSVNAFIDTGDLDSFFRYYIVYDSHAKSNLFTLDFCLFLHRLRNLKERIGQINRTHDLNLELEVAGAESDPPYTLNDMVHLSRNDFLEKKLNYFVYERDRLCSLKIQDYLDTHPGAKAIVFYGSLHMIREKVDKNQEKRIVKKEMPGYYLAHYLDSLYARENICVFYNNPVFNFEYEKIIELKGNDLQPDYVVLIKPYPNHPLSFLFGRSRTYLAALHTLLSQYRDKNSAEGQLIFRNLALQWGEIMMHTCQSRRIQPSGDIKQLAENLIENADTLLQTYDVSEVLDHCEDLTNRFMPNDYFDSELVKMLSNIPSMEIDFMGSGVIENGQLSRETAEKVRNHKEDISVYLAIHQLSVADENECKIIMAYLNSKLNLGFQTREEWVDWWQNRYTGSG